MLTIIGHTDGGSESVVKKLTRKTIAVYVCASQPKVAVPPFAEYNMYALPTTSCVNVLPYHP